MALTFVAGHVFGSMAAPLALAESLWPARRHTAWLGPAGIGVVVVLWAAGACFIVKDQVDSTPFRVSSGQVAGTVAVSVLLVLLAFTRAPHQAALTGSTPAPWVVALVSGVLLAVRSVVPTGWAATLVAIGGPAFITTPLGDIPVWQKVVSNVVLLTLVLSVAAVALAVESRRTLSTLG